MHIILEESLNYQSCHVYIDSKKNIFVYDKLGSHKVYSKNDIIQQNTNYKESIKGDKIINIDFDKQGNLVYITDKDIIGINLNRGNINYQSSQYKYLDGLISNDKYIWVIANSGVVGVFSTFENRLTNEFYLELPGKPFSICEDNLSNKWFLTWDSIIKVIDKDHYERYFLPEKEKINDSFRLESCQNTGEVFLVSEEELIKVTRDGKFDKFNIDKQISVTSIDREQNGSYWIGTRNGLVQYNKISGSTRYYSIDDGLADNFIQTVRADREGDYVYFQPDMKNHFISSLFFGAEGTGYTLLRCADSGKIKNVFGL